MQRTIGTPIGTVIASPCATEPVSTPRRALVLLNAKVAADNAAQSTPSTGNLSNLARRLMPPSPVIY
jgi:hypothetical protein